MTHELKFRYVYGIPGKPKTYFFRYFTIEEIENGLNYYVLFNEKTKDFKEVKIISRDQFTGLTDINKKEGFFNDDVNWIFDDGPVKCKLSWDDHRKCVCFKPYDNAYGLSHEIHSLMKFEIIGNIYGISTKNDNPNPNKDT